MDDAGQHGPVETGADRYAGRRPPTADRGTASYSHSFDPCLACSVHMMHPDSKVETVIQAAGAR
jgi:Ni,Fe-hydrogenase I large subunit